MVQQVYDLALELCELEFELIDYFKFLSNSSQQPIRELIFYKQSNYCGLTVWPTTPIKSI